MDGIPPTTKCLDVINDQHDNTHINLCLYIQCEAPKIDVCWLTKAPVTSSLFEYHKP